MAYIILPHKWTRQPQIPLGVNRGTTLASGLRVLSNFAHGSPFDAVSRTFLTRAGTPTRQFAAPGSIGWASDGTADNAFLYAGPTLAPTKYTLLAQFVVNASSSAIRAVVRAGSYAIYHWNDNTLGYYEGNGPGWQSYLTAEAGKVYTIATAAAVFAVNGRLYGTRSSLSPTYGAPRYLADLFSQRLNGAIFLGALWDRELTNAELEEVSTYPWQLFRPIQRRIYVPSAGGGEVTVSVDAAAETDAAQALGKLKARALSAAAETDSAQAVAARKTLAVSVATEADAAQAVGKAKTIAVGHAAETDTAQTIAPLGAIVEAVTAATETDSAQNVGRIKTLALGAAAEADAAQAIAVVIAGEQIVSVAAAAETDTAQVIGARKTLSLASINETDAAQIILPRKALAVQPATEADSAQAIAWAPKILQLGVATETDQAQAITLAAAGLTLEQKCDLLLKLLRNKQITDPATGLMTIYDDDDTTPLLTANIYEDAAGTVLYRGRGAERRERLQ